MGKGKGAFGGLQNLHQQWTGVADQAEAAGKSARAAEAEARRQREETIGEARRVEGNATSVQELQALDQQLATSQKQVARDQKMIDAIDPALMEASSQVLKMLQGDQSSIGGNLEKQRSMQRQKLLNSLREQLGPGAETSTAGMQALNRFDSETGNLSVGAQQQGLGTLMGIYGQGAAQDYSKGMNALGMTAQGFGNRSGRMLAGGQGVLQAMMGGNAGVMNTVGSQYAEQLIRGRGQQQDHQTGVNFMGSMLGGASGGGGKGKPSQEGAGRNYNGTPMTGNSYNDYGGYA